MATDGVMTALPPSLTLRDAPTVLETLRQAFAADGGDVWRIDAAPVTQLDTSALAVLLECSRMAAGAKRKLQIVNPPVRMSDLAHLYGVDEMLGIEAGDFPPVRLPERAHVVVTPGLPASR